MKNNDATDPNQNHGLDFTIVSELALGGVMVKVCDPEQPGRKIMVPLAETTLVIGAPVKATVLKE
jgi:hypothetical protein